MHNLTIDYLFSLGLRVHSFLIKECWVDSVALSANHCANYCFPSPPKMAEISGVIDLEELLFWKITWCMNGFGQCASHFGSLPSGNPLPLGITL